MPTLLLLVALVLIKVVLLALDHTLRLYLGDSAAFLYGAMDEGRLPDDRSFTYSLLIRGLVRPSGQLIWLAWWQAAVGVVVALLWWRLARRFAVPRAPAATGALLLAVEPAQLFYERMVLAETFGLFAFVLFVAASAAYLATRTWWWLAVAATLGLMAASLRLNYLPVVLVMSTVLPLLPLVESGRARVRLVAGHFAVALIATLAVHAAYRYTVAEVFRTPPGYLARAGFMQLGLVVPLVQPQHFEQLGLPGDLETVLQFPLASPHARMRHMWTAGGLVSEIKRRQLDVESIARPLARMAIADDPFGLVRLGVHTVGDYFRQREIEHALWNDLGRRPIPEPILWSLREDWGYDARDVPARDTLVSRAFTFSTWWLVLCLFALVPLALLNLAVHWWTPLRLQALAVTLISLGLVASHLLFVPVAFYRYLHPLPFFVLLHGVALASRWMVGRRLALDTVVPSAAR